MHVPRSLRNTMFDMRATAANLNQPIEEPCGSGRGGPGASAQGRRRVDATEENDEEEARDAQENDDEQC